MRGHFTDTGTRVRWVTLALLLLLCAARTPCETLDNKGWALAVPGYAFSFPRDYGPHNNFRTEWWYFTGNLKSKEGREFGYEVAFFRYGYRLPDKRAQSRFVMNDLKFAHFALTDLGTSRFRFDSRTSRGPMERPVSGKKSDWHGSMVGKFHSMGVSN